MATKVYAIAGKTTVELNINIGKATLPLCFEHGCLDRKNYKPATYSTSNKAIQDMIEGSPYFGKTIRLYKIYNADAESETSAAAKSFAKPEPVPVEPQEFPEITTLEEAQAKLKSLGAKATQLTGAGMKKFMALHKISFPNLATE